MARTVARSSSSVFNAPSGPAPTPEQDAAVDAFETGGSLVLEAGAGSGKTTTLKMLARATPHRQGIYVAYNKAIATDAQASFPANVKCATAHSLAYRALGHTFKHRLNAPRLPLRRTAAILGIHDYLNIGIRSLAPTQVARIVMETVANFCNSDAAHVKPWHVPHVHGVLEPAEVAQLREFVLPLAELAWRDLRSHDGQLRFTHDVYLKLWQLSGPQLQGDFILLDEAQDANPVIAAIVQGQGHMQQVMVGDANQAIYGWRGAVDAMSSFEADHHLYLTHSFRFGPAVADEANKWLELLDARLRIVGFDAINSRVEPLTNPDAVLCRTNAGALGLIMASMGAGQRTAMVGGGGHLIKLAEAAMSLKANQGTDHPELCAFRSWDEVVEYVTEDNAGSDLKVFVKLVDQHGPQAIINACRSLVDEPAAQVVYSTAHKAKGREWSAVKVASDFNEPREGGEESRMEAMLSYVTVTRAKQVLDRAGLEFIDKLLVRQRRAAEKASV